MIEKICILSSVNIIKSITTNYLLILKQNSKINSNSHGLTYIPIFVSRFSYVIARILFVY